MVGQTIAERLCQTKSLTARHILQDEAAIFGAQGMVSEELESKLTAAEGTDCAHILSPAICGSPAIGCFPIQCRASDHTLT
jgi:hypothetical protein